MALTKRSQNRCRDCNYTWYPKGKSLSIKCPNCGGRSVTFVISPIVYLVIGLVGLMIVSWVIDSCQRAVKSGQRAWRDFTDAHWAESPPTVSMSAGGGYQGPVESTSTETQELPTPPPMTIADAQRTLKRLGYDTGPADGKVGRRTRSAVRAFQAKRGLPVTGELNAQLFAELQADHPPAEER
jgi:hypothetical protein